MIICIAGITNTYLVSLGSYFGYSQQVIELPVKTSRIKKPLPKLPIYLHIMVCAPLLSIFPTILFVNELLPLVKSIWRESYYLMFMFLLTSLVLMALTSGLISILQTYWLIKRGYYEWQWRSFLTGFYVFYYVFEILQTYYYTVIRTKSVNESMRNLFDSDNIIFLVFSLFTAVMVGLMCASFSYISSFLFL